MLARFVGVAVFVLSVSVLGAQELVLRAPQNLKPGFILGADVSMLDQIEKAGGTYSDAAGRPGDALVLLKAAGLNWIRLRLWVNPDDGHNDLASYLRIAQRAKKLGLKVEADFHYADFWADPSKQPTPAAWQSLDLAGLKKQVYRYTFDCLKAMKAQGALPDMVQVGNEVNNGFLWPVGKLYPSEGETGGGIEAFAALLKEGVRAVHETDKRIKIMIHLADGGSNATYRKVFDPLVQRGLDFDVIGLSFYPYWHGKLSDLADNLNDLADRYKKDLIVAETAYAWTLEPGDDFANSFGPGSDRLGGYKATVQGQAAFLADLIGVVADAGGRGTGIFYWEPDWIPAPGVGWTKGEGNNWENQTLFDYQGRALKSLEVFKKVRVPAEFPDLTVVSVDEVKLKMAAGAVLVLPDKVLVTYSDDTYRLAQVKWTRPDPAALGTVGTLTVKGEMWGYPRPVVATVEIAANANLIADAGFESGRLDSGWVVTGPGASAALVEKNPGNAHTGDWSFKYWLDKPFQFTLMRRVEGLADGRYTFRAWAAGGGGEKAFSLFARLPGGPAQTVDIVDTGWQKWRLYEIKGFEVKGGVGEIGLTIDGATGNWGNVDDVEFVKEE
jgi:arabinogalactan endo-1,4-beta-galactosidase